MERFCNKCGSLVSGEGVFCPNCGEKLDSVVDLGKSSDSVSTPVTPSVPVNTSMPSAPMSAPSVYSTNNTTNSTTGVGSSQGQIPNYGAPVYPQNNNNNNSEMTVGQWVLTTFLSGLGIIGLILLFVWAFGSGTPTSKKNYARAMLIWQAVALGLVILYFIGVVACVGCAGMGLEDIFADMDYYAAFMR